MILYLYVYYIIKKIIMVRRAIHSFYSKSYNELELFMHSCYFILSCLCANKSGIIMDMYTDDNFKEFIDIAPYENIKTLENDYEDTYLFPSYSKVKALENEPLGTVHIDNTIMIKNNILRYDFELSDYDCLIYNKYNDVKLDQWILNASNILCTIAYNPWMSRDIEMLYDTSILAFNNKRLFDDWHDSYLYMLDNIKNQNLIFDNHSKPDEIINNHSLTSICKFNRYSVKTIYNEDAMDPKIGDRIECFKNLKYNLPKCLLLIKLMDKRMYQKLIDKWYNKYSEFFNIDIQKVII